MAENKNSFIKSKMNKDLDDRLIPNNEYRDANNIAVSRSENQDVGALEAILGNEAVFSSAGYFGQIIEINQELLMFKQQVLVGLGKLITLMKQI